MQSFYDKVWILPRIKLLSNWLYVIFKWPYIFQLCTLQYIMKFWNKSKQEKWSSVNKQRRLKDHSFRSCYVIYENIVMIAFMSLIWWYFCEMLSHVNVKTQFLSHMIKKKVLVPYHLYSCINPAWSCPGAAIPAKLSNNVDTDRGSQMETTC